MDKIWYRNPSKSEVIGRCGGDEKTNDHAEPQNKYKKMNKKMMGLILLDFRNTKLHLLHVYCKS